MWRNIWIPNWLYRWLHVWAFIVGVWGMWLSGFGVGMLLVSMLTAIYGAWIMAVRISWEWGGV